MTIVAAAYRSIAQILLDAVDKKLGAGRLDATTSQPPSGQSWMDLTPDQLNHIAKTGKLPEGVTPDMLMGVPGI